MPKWEGKIGKFCPIQFKVNEDGLFKNRTCNDQCAWYSDGIKACVLHGMNMNLQTAAGKKKVVNK